MCAITTTSVSFALIMSMSITACLAVEIYVCLPPRIYMEPLDLQEVQTLCTQDFLTVHDSMWVCAHACTPVHRFNYCRLWLYRQVVLNGGD